MYHTTFSPTAAVGSCGSPCPGGSPRSVLTNPFGVRLAARAAAPLDPNGSPPASSVSGPSAVGDCTGPCGSRTSSSCSTSGATEGSAANTPPRWGGTGAEIIACRVSSHTRLAGHCSAAWAAGAPAAACASSKLASRVVAAIGRTRREPDRFALAATLRKRARPIGEDHTPPGRLPDGSRAFGDGRRETVRDLVAAVRRPALYAFSAAFELDGRQPGLEVEGDRIGRLTRAHGQLRPADRELSSPEHKP